MKKILFTALVMGSLTACGSNQEPLSVLGDPTAIPQFVLPVTTLGTGSAAYSFSAATAARNGWDIPIPVASSVPILSPTTGVVSSIDVNGSVYGVTILFNSKYATRVANLAAVPNVQVGNYIAQGATIATIASLNTATTVHFTVIQNSTGATLCPSSFVTAAALNTFQTQGTQNTQPCVP